LARTDAVAQVDLVVALGVATAVAAPLRSITASLCERATTVARSARRARERRHSQSLGGVKPDVTTPSTKIRSMRECRTALQRVSSRRLTRGVAEGSIPSMECYLP
jgi:hypothetical protein